MTEREQRLLTEFLGAKWHDSNVCTCSFPYTCNGSKNLDFTDWRVVGRLLEKFKQIDLYQHDGNQYARFGYTGEPYIGKTKQEAICAAVLAYLENKP